MTRHRFSKHPTPLTALSGATTLTLVLSSISGHSSADALPATQANEHNRSPLTTPSEPRTTAKQTPFSAPKRLTRTTTHEKLTFAVGSYFSHGDYSSTKPTDVISVPFRISYQRNQWSFNAQLPYLHISGPENVLVIREGGETVVEASDQDTQRQGFGDLRLSSQYVLPWQPINKARWHLGGGVKVPTADENENLGTGEFDYHLYTGGYYRQGSWIMDGKVGHQWMGDTDDTDYNNRVFFSLGGRHLLSRSQSISLHYSHKDASSDRSEAVESLTASFHQKLNYGWKVSFSAGMGLSDSSADVFGGLQISKSLIRKKRR